MQSSSSGCHENKNIISENTERHHLCPVAEEMYISPGTYAHWKKMPSFPCVFMMETLECMGRTSLRGPILMTQPSVLLQWKHRMNCISRAAQRPLPTLRLKNRIIKELESFVKKSLLKCSHDQMLFFFPIYFNEPFLPLLDCTLAVSEDNRALPAPGLCINCFLGWYLSIFPSNTAAALAHSSLNKLLHHLQDSNQEKIPGLLRSELLYSQLP